MSFSASSRAVWNDSGIGIALPCLLLPRRLTDSTLSCEIRSKGFDKGIRNRRQVTRSARAFGPKDEQLVGGRLSNTPRQDFFSLQRLVMRRATYKEYYRQDNVPGLEGGYRYDPRMSSGMEPPQAAVDRANPRLRASRLG